jgi:hypothetical protein
MMSADLAHQDLLSQSEIERQRGVETLLTVSLNLDEVDRAIVGAWLTALADRELGVSMLAVDALRHARDKKIIDPATADWLLSIHEASTMRDSSD